MITELQKYGLQPIGKWVKSDIHSSVAHLRGECKTGIDFSLPPEWKFMQNVVYAFIMNKHIRYIGETSAGLSSRFTSYRYGNPLVRDTDNRVKVAITEALNNNYSVEIWAACPTAGYKLPGGNILTVPVSKPLEEHLIGVIRPDLNVKNLSAGNVG